MRRAETKTTSTCADASIVSSAAPGCGPMRKDYYQLCDSWVRVREAARFSCLGSFLCLFFSL